MKIALGVTGGVAAYKAADAGKRLTLQMNPLSQKQLAEWLAAQLK